MMREMKLAILAVVAGLTVIGTVQWVRAGMPNWPPRTPAQYEVSGQSFRSVIIGAVVTFDELEPEAVERIARLEPTLRLENGEGDQADIFSWKIEKGRLVTGDLGGLEPVLYTFLVARYPGGKEEVFLVDVDLREVGRS
ncbi:MAG TPA: hypothetical protein VNT01_01265 [Symbiobacteriaceae bacterium]|nr:hypothetical protein [Symbiobacteriaceae bacterium]